VVWSTLYYVVNVIPSDSYFFAQTCITGGPTWKQLVISIILKSVKIRKPRSITFVVKKKNRSQEAYYYYVYSQAGYYGFYGIHCIEVKCII